MKCSNCGHVNKKNTKFCVKCGSKLTSNLNYNINSLDLNTKIIIVLGILLLIYVIASASRGGTITKLENENQKLNKKYVDLEKTLTDYNKLFYDGVEVMNISQKLIDEYDNNLTELKKLDVDNKNKILNLNNEIDLLKENSNKISCQDIKLDLNFESLSKVNVNFNNGLNMYSLNDNSFCKSNGWFITKILSHTNKNNNKFLLLSTKDSLNINLPERHDSFGIYLNFYFSDIDSNSSGNLLSFGNKDNYINIVKDGNIFYFKQYKGNSIEKFDINFEKEYNFYVGITKEHSTLYIKDLYTNITRGRLLDQVQTDVPVNQTQYLYYLNYLFIDNSTLDKDELDENKRLYNLNKIVIYDYFDEDFILN
jgi:hypothetical protein